MGAVEIAVRNVKVCLIRLCNSRFGTRNWDLLVPLAIDSINNCGPYNRCLSCTRLFFNSDIFSGGLSMPIQNVLSIKRLTLNSLNN